MKWFRYFVFIFLLSGGCLLAQYTGKSDTLRLTDIAQPQPQFQVVSGDTYSRIATQEEAMRDIRERLNGIDQSIKDIKADVKVLMDTNTVVHFLVTTLEILVPGLLCTYFGIGLYSFLQILGSSLILAYLDTD